MMKVLLAILILAIFLCGQDRQEDSETVKKIRILKEYSNQNERHKILLLKVLLENKRKDYQKTQEAKNIGEFLKDLYQQNRELQEVNKQLESRLASLETKLEDNKQLEIRISEIEFQVKIRKIWEKCWKEEEGYFDFTEPDWENLPIHQQIEYASKYQEWYANRIGKSVETEKSAGNTKVVMVLVPPGKFWMGSKKTEKDRNTDEHRHKVLISKFFWISKYEITQKQWLEVMKDSLLYYKNFNESVPAEVSWDDCQKFCQKMGLNLPTEAQWEYACRAGTTSTFNTGEDINSARVNYDGNYPYKGIIGIDRGSTVSVGSLDNKNAWGCYDFHGNVWEWCNDRYDSGYYARFLNSEIKEPSGSDSGLERCLRGGSWRDSALNLRAAYRNWAKPSSSFFNVGFRVCSILESYSENKK